MMLKKVAVCIPTYNRKNLLCKTIDSVLKSTFLDFDLYIFDNHSVDGTVECIENKYGSLIKKIVVQKTNVNWNGNANAILDMFYLNDEYKYMLMLHDDDLLHQDFLRRTVELIESDKDIAFVGTPYEIIDENDKLTSVFKYGGLDNTVILDYKDYFRHRAKGFFMAWSGTLMRINKIKSNRFGSIEFNGKIHPIFDDIIFFTYLAINNKVAYIPEYLFQNRNHSTSSMTTMSAELIYSELVDEINFFSNILITHNIEAYLIKEYKTEKNIHVFYANVRMAKSYKELFSSLSKFAFSNEYFKLKQIKYFPVKLFSNKLIEISK